MHMFNDMQILQHLAACGADFLCSYKPVFIVQGTFELILHYNMQILQHLAVC